MVPNSKQSCGLVRKKKKKQPSSASVQTEVFPPILVDHAAKTQLVVDQEDSHLELHTGQVRLGQVRYLTYRDSQPPPNNNNKQTSRAGRSSKLHLPYPYLTYLPT